MYIYIYIYIYIAISIYLYTSIWSERAAELLLPGTGANRLLARHVYIEG